MADWTLCNQLEEKEQHSAAVQLGKGVRDTIQVLQGPLPVLNW